MIVRRGTAKTKERDDPNFGGMLTEGLSEAGGLKQPGARSSARHWHEQEDEFLFVVSGQATVVEDACSGIGRRTGNGSTERL